MTKTASADRIEPATSAAADRGGAEGIAATAADEAASAMPIRKPATRAATPRSSAPRKTGSGGSKARKPSVTAVDGVAPAEAGTRPKARATSVKSEGGVKVGVKNKVSSKKKIGARSAVTSGAGEVALEGEGDGASEPKKRRGPPSGTLVIVESPAKAKTIKKYLGAGFVVKASVGHVKDLPKKKIGIDIEHDFQPEYVVIEGKKKVLD